MIAVSGARYRSPITRTIMLAIARIPACTKTPELLLLSAIRSVKSSFASFYGYPAEAKSPKTVLPQPISQSYIC